MTRGDIEPFDDLRTQTSTDNTDLLSKSRVDVHMSRHGSITVRAQQRELWPICGRCRQWLQSKGFQPRTLYTLFGVICWRRRVGRCPKGCKGSPIAPLDQALGLVPHQRTGEEVQWMGCLLAVFVPYKTAR